ncbi:MAG: threonine/serine dehydratase [Planctomycetota bacterium]
MQGVLPVTPEEVAAAHRRLHGVCHNTLFFTVSALDEAAGCHVYLKGENFQRIGAFKMRGAYNFLAQLDEAERAKGVVAASSGNHGQGVARAAKLLGCPAVLVLPEDVVPVKREAIERDGAEIVLAGLDSSARFEKAQAIARERGMTIVHAFNPPWIVAGQGTVGKEMLEAVPHLDTLVVPIGGGGLISGIAIWAKSVNPRIKIFGVEPEDCDSMRQSIEAKEPVTIEPRASIADGLRPSAPGSITFHICSALLDGIVTVSDAEIAEGVRFLLGRAKVLVEPSGAAGLAALLHNKLPHTPTAAGTVLCGGNADFGVLARILQGDV